MQRYKRARRDGLSAEQAARAVGVSRSSLHRWSRRIEPKSRRPHQLDTSKNYVPERVRIGFAAGRACRAASVCSGRIVSG